ncbi:MAG: lytic transglycosylase domain-containing protein [Gammaproteobacteria bacterium]|nr:lytic transglycosylase domain-containing protein [Gammaproteobacteria bacterium]
MSAPATAATYKFTDQDGTVWFTDKKLTQNRFAQYEPFKRSAKSTAQVSCVPAGQADHLRRLAKYDPIIRAYAKSYAVNQGLIHAIVSVESCYDANAVSSVGAQGLMQLMPETASELGVEDAFDARENLRAGIEYFSMLNKKFNYNHSFALAAYNAGPGAVEKYQGIPPYKETRDYVAKVLKKYREFITTPASMRLSSGSSTASP